MLHAKLRILTSDRGLGQYESIPLDGKKSYKVANSVGGTESFCIIAVTVDIAKPQTIVRRGATKSRIGIYMQYAADTVISSATGKVYVNVSPVAAAGGGAKLRFGGNGASTAGTVQNMIGLGMTLYNWYSPSTDEPEFEFSIGARETKSTKFVTTGDVTLEHLWGQIEKAGAFESSSSLGQQAYGGMSQFNEVREQATNGFTGLMNGMGYLLGRLN